MRRATGLVLQKLRVWAACLLLGALYASAAAAVNVTSLAYDPTKDQLVMTVAYRGTHDKHEFSVQWAECKPLDDARSQILGLLVDSHPDDLARQEFRKQVEVDLSGFSCRPSRVTIRTSAGFFASVDVPPAPKHEDSATPTGVDVRNAR